MGDGFEDFSSFLYIQQVFIRGLISAWHVYMKLILKLPGDNFKRARRLPLVRTKMESGGQCHLLRDQIVVIRQV